MRILVHEFVTGGGWYSIHPTELPPLSLRREGEFMVRETCRSLLEVPGIEIVTLRDSRLSDSLGPVLVAQEGFASIHSWLIRSKEKYALFSKTEISNVDGVILIAPEFDRHLHGLAWEFRDAKLMGPHAGFINLCSDKHWSAQWMIDNNVLAPRGARVPRGSSLSADFPYPAVIKPIDGCGSLGVRIVNGPDDPILDDAWRNECRSADLRLEEFISGQPASVGVIVGKNESVFLPPFFQWIEPENNFSYRGGALVEDPKLIERAHRLAAQALAALPPALGYVGFDIIFGDAADGSQDYVIEVNPRFTTSFAALMGHVAGPEYSLMGALIDLIEGRPAKIKWKDEPLRFSVDEFD